MFSKILVPLDGSVLAEQALAPACRVAERFGGTLLLLRVVTPERTTPGLQHLTLRPENVSAISPRPLLEEAEAYLAGLRLPTPGLPVETEVVAGAAPEMIIATAAYNYFQRRIAGMLSSTEVLSNLVLAYLSDAREPSTAPPAPAPRSAS